MSLPRFAVRRPVATLMFFVAVCLMGLFAWIQLPVDLMPNATAGTLTIYIGVRGGLPPEDIETLVTKITEDAVSSVQHLRNLLSVSRKDRSTVTLTYEPGTDLSFAALEVQERLAKIKNKLPKDIEKPIVAHYSENDYPVIILALTSDKYSPERLRELVDNNIKPQLMRVSGVANVEVGGGRERKILVEFDQTRLEAYRLSIRQVIDTIGKNNVNLLTGKREDERSSFFIRTMGQYQTMDDLRKLVILRSPQGSTIRLEDVADVKDFYLEAQSYARLNKKPTVSIYVQKENNSNTIRVAERVLKVANRVRDNVLGSDIQLQVVTDQSVFIREAMENVTSNLTWGMLFTLLVIWYFLKEWRHTILVFLSAPIAALITLAFMWITGLSLNVMTLSALALGIGIVVDSATVVLENILDKKREAAHHPEMNLEEDSIKATEELFISLVGGTLTTIVVFLPIVFINKQVKILYSGLAYTIAFSMAASLLVAVTLIPLLASRISLPKHNGFIAPETHEKIRQFWADCPPFLHRAAAFLMRVKDLIFPTAAPVPRGEAPPGRWARLKSFWFERLWPAVHREFLKLRAHPRRTYVHWCAWCLRYQRVISVVMAVATAGAMMMYLFVLEKDFMGTTEQNEFIIFIELPAGAKLDISDQVVREVEKVLSDTPEIAGVVKTAAARVEGWSSKVYVTLRPRAERSRSIQDIITDLRPKVADIGQQFDSFVYFSEPESSKEFLIDTFGPEYTNLRDMASGIAQKLQSVKGLTDIKLRYKPGQPEVQIKVDKERAALFGLTIKDVSEDLHARIRGLRPTYFYTENAEIEIIARDQEKFRKTLEDVHYLTLTGPDGTLIPIDQLAEFNFALTPSEVWRKDKQRVIQVSANRDKLPLSTAAKRTLSAMKGLEAPTGYYFQIGGDYVDMVQNEKEFRFAFFIMVGLVFIVLASLFESYIQALMIMVTIPMAMIGSIPLLWITHTSATMSVYIGMIMLGGIAVSAAIILVEKINQSRAEGTPLMKAVLKSSWLRLSPILNTSLTTIVDLIPMALSRSESASLWAPLSLTVIGGATMSTFLTLFMIPALYYHIEAFKERFMGRVAAAEIPAIAGETSASALQPQ
jgi:HAE1 family hydrophobic/amphiphilic exporter-1